MSHARRDLVEVCRHLRRHNEIGPAGDGLDAPGEALQPGRVLQPGAGVDVGGLERAPPVARRQPGRGGGPFDALRAEPERRRDRGRVAEVTVERPPPAGIALDLVERWCDERERNVP